MADLIWISHPNFDSPPSRVTKEAYEKVWHRKGWRETDPPQPPEAEVEEGVFASEAGEATEPESPSFSSPFERSSPPEDSDTLSDDDSEEE